MAERLPSGPGLGSDPGKNPVFLLMVSGQIDSAEVTELTELFTAHAKSIKLHAMVTHLAHCVAEEVEV